MMLGPKKKAEPSGPAAKRAKRGAVSAVKIEQPPGKYVKSKPFARWHHLTTMTRILFVFLVIFEFSNPTRVQVTEVLNCTKKQNPEGSWS